MKKCEPVSVQHEAYRQGIATLPLRHRAYRKYPTCRLVFDVYLLFQLKHSILSATKTYILLTILTLILSSFCCKHSSETALSGITHTLNVAEFNGHLKIFDFLKIKQIFIVYFLWALYLEYRIQQTHYCLQGAYDLETKT